jgi:hypothetical protein
VVNRESSPGQQHIANDGGAVVASSSESDPFEQWIALMEAVEALCPEWPEREHRIEGVFLL